MIEILSSWLSRLLEILNKFGDIISGLCKLLQKFLRWLLLGFIKKKIAITLKESQVLSAYDYPRIWLKLEIDNFVPLRFITNKQTISIKEDSELGLCRIVKGDLKSIKGNNKNSYGLEIELEPFSIIRHSNIRADDNVNFRIELNLYSIFIGEFNIEKEQLIKTIGLNELKKKLKDSLNNFLK